MTVQELARLVEEMRRLQCRYFKHRRPEDLLACKELESSVDRRVREVLDHDDQQTLFER